MKNTHLAFIFLFMGLFVGAQTSQKTKDSLLNKLDEVQAYYSKSEFVKAIKGGQPLVEMSEKIGLDSITLEAYYNLGMGYEAVREYEKALENYKEALHYAKVRQDSVFLIMIYNGLGNIEALKNENYEKSNQYYYRALKISRRVAPDYSVAFIGNLCWNFVENETLEKVEPFIPELEAYLKNTEPDNSNKGNFLSKINNILGLYYSTVKDYANAEPHFDEGIRIACKYDLWENLKNGYKFRSQFFAAQGMYKKAYEDAEEGHIYKEKYLNAKTKDQLAIQDSSNQLKEKEKALLASKHENKLLDKIAYNRTVVIYIVAFVTLILIVFLIVIYRGSQAKKRLINLLNKRNDELIIAKEKTEEATELKNQFISNISHEIRTPLHGVTGTTALLLENKGISEENRNLLKSLKFSGDYLLSLINNVLYMTKIDNKKIRVNPKNITIPIFIENLKNTTQFLAKKNNTQVRFEVDKTIPKHIYADSALLSEILINLIENAIKFSKDGEVKTTFKLMAKETGKLKIRFMVDDTGSGIPDDKKDLVFEKFSQIFQGQNEVKGTGLGLSIVKKLLEILDSKIHLESELGKGSTFYFDLDCGYSRKKSDQSNLEFDLKNFEGKRILLIEDNEINKLVVKKFLEPLGVILTDVSDGKEGFDLLLNNDFDLALVDINIPSMTGYEISREVRKQNNPIPIIAVTASEPDETEESAKKNGMNGILIKPFRKEELYQIIESFLI